MRRSVAQAACIALPFVTATVGGIVTPGYPVTGHATTLSMATIIGFGALFALTLNMRNSADTDPGWPVAAGWLLATSIFIVAMMETVILKPRGIDNRQWLPCMALAAIAILSLCERDGTSVDRAMLQRASSLAMVATGGVLAISVTVAAAASRLSGNNIWAIGLTILSLPFILGGFVQTQRVAQGDRARLGVGILLMLYMIIVTSEGTYTWTPHYSDDAMSRQVFQ